MGTREGAAPSACERRVFFLKMLRKQLEDALSFRRHGDLSSPSEAMRFLSQEADAAEENALRCSRIDCAFSIDPLTPFQRVDSKLAVWAQILACLAVRYCHGNLL